MMTFALKRAPLACALGLGLVAAIAAADPASQTPDETDIDALLNQGKSELGQRVRDAGQEARTQLRDADREYQSASDRITTLRNDTLINTVVPEFVDGTVKGAGGAAAPPPMAAPAADPHLPSMNTPGPISIAFEHSSNRSQGSAHVISVPPGIDCPPSCSARFGQGVDVTIQATADPNSVLRVVECYAWTAGPTTQRLPGNTLTCGWPGLVAARGGKTVVLVDAVPAGGAAGVTGVGGSMGSAGSQPGSLGSGAGGTSASGGGGVAGCKFSSCVSPLPGTCITDFKDPKYYHWTSFTNNCDQPVHLTYNVVGTGWGTNAMDLGPGRSDNTGLSATDAPNGFVLAVCPMGYSPWNPTSSRSWNGTGEFICVK